MDSEHLGIQLRIHGCLVYLPIHLPYCTITSNQMCPMDFMGMIYNVHTLATKSQPSTDQRCM